MTYRGRYASLVARMSLAGMRVTGMVAAVAVASIVMTTAASAASVGRVEVQALMKDAAMLRIDQGQHMLRVGERSPEGVKLVAASPREAVIEVEGQRRTLTLSNRIAGNFEEPTQSEVQIARNQNQQYLTTAEINGRRVLVQVDTGANSVAMSGNEASKLGIDYQRKGTPTMIGTASGVAQGYAVVLDKVTVGGISASFVEATVIEGNFPMHVLLGTTFLQHVGMREEGGIMYLKQKF